MGDSWRGCWEGRGVSRGSAGVLGPVLQVTSTLLSRLFEEKSRRKLISLKSPPLRLLQLQLASAPSFRTQAGLPEPGERVDQSDRHFGSTLSEERRLPATVTRRPSPDTL